MCTQAVRARVRWSYMLGKTHFPVSCHVQAQNIACVLCSAVIRCDFSPRFFKTLSPCKKKPTLPTLLNGLHMLRPRRGQCSRSTGQIEPVLGGICQLVASAARKMREVLLRNRSFVQVCNRRSTELPVARSGQRSDCRAGPPDGPKTSSV